MDAWGFTYKSQMVWVKDRAGTGYWARQKHELLLIGTRGEPSSPIATPESAIIAPRGRHSEKPEIFRKTIDAMFPHWTGVKLELFQRTPAPGWLGSGYEAHSNTV